mgnify:CR=1 FL=1
MSLKERLATAMPDRVACLAMADPKARINSFKLMTKDLVVSGDSSRKETVDFKTASIIFPVSVLSSYLTKNKRMGIKEILGAFALGAQNMVVTGVLLIAVGIIVGIINISGIGITFSQLIMEWSGNSLLLAIVLVAIASLILGMGLPVTASYVVLSVLSAPALAKEPVRFVL